MVRLLILAATIVFIVALGYGTYRDKVEGVESLAFGIRWAIVGLYVAFANTAITTFSNPTWEIMGLILAIVALGTVDYVLTAAVNRVNG